MIRIVIGALVDHELDFLVNLLSSFGNLNGTEDIAALWANSRMPAFSAHGQLSEAFGGVSVEQIESIYVTD